MGNSVKFSKSKCWIRNPSGNPCGTGLLVSPQLLHSICKKQLAIFLDVLLFSRVILCFFKEGGVSTATFKALQRFADLTTSTVVVCNEHEMNNHILITNAAE